MNGKQSVKLKSCSISFKNYFKQITVLFKLYADFACILKGVKSNDKNMGSYTEKYQEHISCSIKFNKKVVLYRGKNAVYRFIEGNL